MTEHAALIRKLRKDRGLTQEQLTSGISQRGTLAAFESRGTKIGFELIVNYLDRMNITLEEYQFLLNSNSLSNKQKLTNYLITSKTITSAQEQELLNEFEKTGNIYYRLIYAQRKLISNYLYSSSFTASMKEEISVIKKYLEKIDTWGHFELTIFSNCLFIFDDEYIAYSFQNSVIKMKSYLDNTYYSELLSNFILNGVRLSFNRESTTLRKLFLAQLKKIATTHKQTLDLAHYKVFAALDKLADGQKTALKEVETGIAFFEWLDLSTSKDYMINLKEKFSAELCEFSHNDHHTKVVVKSTCDCLSPQRQVNPV
ncbi:transcriptional regulator [Enterococcus mundtii]|uniref:helix-turn-helix domain-containing protein n=1 Tax=Enterococcus TaxID=1350 RepID=UPI000F7D06A1|nr:MULTISPECIES: transcriptional regulator [Enterococcus]AZP92241.1 transcriptional regulator [Enterococcus mundtii]MEC3941493.1 transcriptional regulator [Enterococcus mundtii]